MARAAADRVVPASDLPLPAIPATARGAARLARGAAAACWRLLPPLLLLLLIWWPEYNHFRIDRSPPAPAAVAALRSQPDTTLLREVGDIRLLLDPGRIGYSVADLARQIAGGSLLFPRLDERSLPLQGYPADYLDGPPSLRLFVASLSIEGILLDAYNGGGDARYLELALRRVRQFADYEASRRHDRSFLWNDHAVAARVSVLTRLWADVRQRADLQPEDAAAIAAFALRSGRMLARPGQFTVRTNHGVVQNIALLQLAAAFPAFAEAARWRELAVERLQLQLGFLVSDEGVVLEHSAEYHAFGLETMTVAIRLLQLNGLPVPPALALAASRATGVLSQLLRPDSSLPLIGDTDLASRHRLPAPDPTGAAAPRDAGQPAAIRRQPLSLWPAAGWAVVWDGDGDDSAVQTALSWANHAGHGHKKADDGAVHLWSGGVDWLTASGYWPYGDPLAAAAAGWQGANAPHLIGEPARSARQTALRSSGSADGIALLEVVRDGPGRVRFNRQVVRVAPELLLVLDFAGHADAGVETVWTLDPSLRIDRALPRQRYLSSAAADGRRLQIGFASAQPFATELHRASTAPFAGWVVEDGRPRPASAIRFTSPAADPASAALFRLRAGEDADFDPPAWQASGPQRWRLVARAGASTLTLSRDGAMLEVVASGEPNQAGRRQTIYLRPAPDIAAQQRALQAAYASAVDQYPPWRDLADFRLKLSYAVIALALLLELAGWLLRRRWPALAAPGRAAALPVALAWLGWAALAVYLLGFYLRT